MLRTLREVLTNIRVSNDRDTNSRFIERFVSVVTFFIVWTIVIIVRLVALMVPGSLRRFGDHLVQLLIIGLVIGVGFFAHEFKKWDQYFYGLVEVCFGICSTIILVFSIAPAEMHLTQWASLIGTAYVIARGRNNIHDAALNPNASRFLSSLRRDNDSFSTS
jgi:hypothetical protein